jgi:adenosylcobyric acid synthase
VDIAVIRLPYMSNYTDFAPLEQEEGVNLYYVSKVSELGTPDLILLPGTRNTIEDLRWLKKSGLARWIDRLVSLRRARDAGLLNMPEEGELPNTPLLMGICGGYQMLGKRILDPLSSEAGGAEGLQRGVRLHLRLPHPPAAELLGLWDGAPGTCWPRSAGAELRGRGRCCCSCC